MLANMIREIKKEISDLDYELLFTAVNTLEPERLEKIKEDKQKLFLKLQILIEAFNRPNLFNEKYSILESYKDQLYLETKNNGSYIEEMKEKIAQLGTWRSYDVLCLFYITIKQQKDDPKRILSDEEYFKLQITILAWQLENTPYYQDGVHVIANEFRKVLELMKAMIGMESKFEFEKDPADRMSYLGYKQQHNTSLVFPEGEGHTMISDKDIFFAK